MSGAARVVWSHAAALGGFGLLAVAQTWPLVTHLSTHLPGTHIGDNASFAWNVWWMRQALASPAVSFMHTDRLFAPGGVSLVLHTHTASGAFAAAALPVDAVAATNLLVIACVALNGIAACALARYVTGSRRAGVVAGVLFLAAPPVTGRLLGHFNLLYAWTLVAAIALFLKSADSRSVGWSAAAGAALGLAAWSDYYIFVYAVLAILVLGALRWRPIRVERERRGSGWLRHAVGALTVLAIAAGGVALALKWTSTNLFTAAWGCAIAWGLLTWRFRIRVNPARPSLVLQPLLGGVAALALVMAPLAWYAAQLWLAGDYTKPPGFWRSAPRGFDVATLVLGPLWHPLTGGMTREWYNARGLDLMETSGWLGLTAPILAVLALRERRDLVQHWPWIVLGWVSLVWAAGAFVSVAGVNIGVLLPQQALRYVPIVENARMPVRALILVSLAAAILAAFWIRSRKPAAAWVVCALAMTELAAAPLPLVTVPRRAVDQVLAASAPGTVLEIPFGYHDGLGMRGRSDNSVLLGQIVHGHPIVGGFIARLPSRVDRAYEQNATIRLLLAGDEPGVASAPTCQSALRDLRAAGVRYVVVTGDASARVVSAMPLKRLHTDASQSLYLVEDRCPPSP